MRSTEVKRSRNLGLTKKLRLSAFVTLVCGPIILNTPKRDWTPFLNTLLRFLDIITACAVATSCCISDEPCQWEMAHFDRTVPKFLDRSFWNSNLRNTSSVPPNIQNMVQIGIRGWAGRTPSLSLFLVLPFVFTAQCTLVHIVTNVTSPHQPPLLFFSWIDLIDADVVHSSMWLYC